MKKRVVVAMSGGVDSSLTAALLKEQDYEIIGITMQIWPDSEKSDTCCSLSAVEDARRVASKIDIPYYVLNLKEEFKARVVDNFISEYKLGRTPNPCVRCNQYIKFEALLKKAQDLGTDFVATGHYARIEKKDRYLIKKGLDPKKDQSYFLYPLTQTQLSKALMPLGELTKSEVRKLAADLGLQVADKPESQEICFIDDDNYGRFLKEYIPEAVKPGPILDRQGNILGMHGGIVFYTVGQRRGLGIAHEKPLYVMSIDREKNTLIVGEWGETFSDELIASEVNLVAIKRLERPIKVTAKIRYNDPEAGATLYPLDENRVRLKFEKPQRAITPGQAVVFYQDDTLVGGGTIER